MTHEYNFGTATGTFAVRSNVIVKKLLLKLDLFLESQRVFWGIRFLAILSRLETSVGMATYVKIRRIVSRRSGEQSM